MPTLVETEQRRPRKDEIVDYYLYIKGESDRWFNATIKTEWLDNIAMYLDRYTLRKKVDWQSQLKDPIADNLVTRLANFFSRILITTEDKYFVIKHPDEGLKRAYEAAVKGILTDNAFPLVFSDALKFSLITAPYITKIEYVVDKETYPVFNSKNKKWEELTKPVGRVKIMPVNPLNFRFDHKAGQYCYELCEVDLAEFEEIAQSNAWFNVKEVVDGMLSDRSRNEDNSSADTTPATTTEYRPIVRLSYVYTKYLTNKDGRVVDKNVHFIIANDKIPVWYENPKLPRGRFPYVVGFPMKSVYHKWERGYISKLKSIIYHYLDSYNLVLDSFALSVLGVWEYDMNGIPHGKEHVYTSGVAPGKFFPTQRPGTVKKVYDNEIPSLALNVLMFQDRTLQNRSFQNEFFMGAPTVKGRPTLGEISIKSQETNSFITDVAAEIERTVIVPTIELVLASLLINFDDENRIKLEQLIPDEEARKKLLALTPNQRIEELINAKIEVKGISGKVQQMNSFSKTMNVISVLGNMPGLLALLDPTKLVSKLFEGIDENPETLIDPSRLELAEQIFKQTIIGGGQPQPIGG